MKKWLISSLLGLVLILAACGEGDPNDVNELDDGGVEENFDDLDENIEEDTEN